MSAPCNTPPTSGYSTPSSSSCSTPTSASAFSSSSSSSSGYSSPTSNVEISSVSSGMEQGPIVVTDTISGMMRFDKPIVSLSGAFDYAVAKVTGYTGIKYTRKILDRWMATGTHPESQFFYEVVAIVIRLIERGVGLELIDLKNNLQYFEQECARMTREMVGEYNERDRKQVKIFDGFVEEWKIKTPGAHRTALNKLRPAVSAGKKAIQIQCIKLAALERVMDKDFGKLDAEDKDERAYWGDAAYDTDKED